jgi:putative hydroxymethylpyrimidine transport system substrate-binding protein
MRKHFSISTTIIGLIFFLASSATASEKLTLILDWFINPDHAPIFIAQERGYFQERGLELEIIAPSNPNDPAKLVAAGKASHAGRPESSLDADCHTDRHPP